MHGGTMNGAFDWRSLGKADYAQAHALVASLPEEHRWKIKGVSHELLARILHLAWICSSKSGRGTAYCYPTLSTLARYVGRSVRTVERHLLALRACGLIQWTHRKNSEGAWTSNLYTMGKVFLASLFARGKKKPQQIQATTKMSTNNLKKGYNAAPSLGSCVDNTRPKQFDKQASDDKPPSHQLWKAPAWMTARS